MHRQRKKASGGTQTTLRQQTWRSSRAVGRSPCVVYIASGVEEYIEETTGYWLINVSSGPDFLKHGRNGHARYRDDKPRKEDSKASRNISLRCSLAYFTCVILTTQHMESPMSGVRFLQKYNIFIDVVNCNM